MQQPIKDKEIQEMLQFLQRKESSAFNKNCFSDATMFRAIALRLINNKAKVFSRPWSNEDKNFLIENYSPGQESLIAYSLIRKRLSIYNRFASLIKARKS